MGGEGGAWEELPPLQHFWLINNVTRLLVCVCFTEPVLGWLLMVGDCLPLGQGSSSEGKRGGGREQLACYTYPIRLNHSCPCVELDGF